MKKPDELAVLKLMLNGMWPRDAGEIVGVHWRRLLRLCEKWVRQKWYGYGVTYDLGWLTGYGLLQAGIAVAAAEPWVCPTCGYGKPGHQLSDECGLVCPCDIIRPGE